MIDKKEEKKNHFILERVFPNVNSILKIKTKKLDEIFKDALFVIDTNSLLAPFQAGKEGVDKIGNIYKKLVSEERIYIPKHVLREFAKHRSKKISELFTNIDNLIASVPTINSFEYPILSELDVYKTIKEKRKDILKELKSYNKHLTELRDGITNWNWSDPVSIMYSNTFSEISIIASSLSEQELIKQYNERIQNGIPPGNKDSSKEENAIGDFLIWKSILKLGKEKKRDIIFVSNDEKNDWMLKGNKKSIFTKFELVNEFYNETDGQNFVSINFKKFLELQGVEVELALDVNISIPFNKDKVGSANGTLKSLSDLYIHIGDFLENQKFEDEEDSYIEDNIDVPIDNFRSSYSKEFFNKPEWNHYSSYFFRFSEMLAKIKTLNYEILYQAHRQKRSTYTQQIELNALCSKFMELYRGFMLVQ